MARRLEAWLTRAWYDGGRPPLALRALTPVYRAGAAVSRAWHRARRAGDLVGRPIVVVGNITVGGTGKTPLVIRLCELLRQAGLTPGVLSRGYGGRVKGPWRVRPNADAAKYGDEAILLARRSGAPVVIARDRVAGARKLFADGVDVIVTDDGLQHLRLPRSMEICVVDAARGLGNGHVLPAGPLREPAIHLSGFDHVVVNGGGGAPATDIEGVSMRLAPTVLKSLNGGGSLNPVGLGERLEGVEVHAFAGIGNPGRFFSQLSALGLEAKAHPMPDHHAYRASDFDDVPAHAMIVMTEKDAVKCQRLDLPNAWYLRVRTQLPETWEKRFTASVCEMVNAARRTAPGASE